MSEQTYHRWRNQFGGPKADHAKHLEDLGGEESTLKRLTADAELEKAALTIARGDLLNPGHAQGRLFDQVAPSARREGSTRSGKGPVEDWLDHHGVEWEYNPDIALDTVDIEKSLQNQARVYTKLDLDRVATYAEALSRGDNFPAVVLRKATGSVALGDGEAERLVQCTLPARRRSLDFGSRVR